MVAPIVGGTLSADFPSAGALLAGLGPDTALTQCTGVLIGCSTFVTAAHCVCDGSGAACQAGTTLRPAGALVYFEHAGFFPIAAIAVHPSFAFPVADVAVVTLATPVTGITPARLNDVATPGFGTPGTIVGFGVTSPAAGDSGLKRVGAVTTAPCVGGISDATSICWDYTGVGANTCSSDSGGPLFIDFGSGPVAAGVTSGGFSATCLPTDHSFDANLFVYRDWIVAQAGGDVGTAACGDLPPVGSPETAVTSFTGELGSTRPLALHSVGVAPGTRELRVGMHGSEAPGDDFDLYVRGGASPAASAYDCRAAGSNQYGFCRIAAPAPGSWFVRGERVAGDGVYQIVATTFGGDAPVCGNDIREPGEACDGADAGTCTTACAACSCVECSPSDLDILEINLSPRLFVQGHLGDASGTYTAIDPPAAGVSLVFTDGALTVTVEVPPGDPGWRVAKARRGRYRWRGWANGLRRLILRPRAKRPTEWWFRATGRDVPGARAVNLNALRARVLLGSRCAERRYRTPAEPRLPR